MSYIAGTEGSHCTGKTENGQKNASRKHRKFGNFAKIQGKHNKMWFAQVVNSLILKVKDNSLFAAKISKFWSDTDKIGKTQRI